MPTTAGAQASQEATALVERRAALFRETPLEQLQRWVFGTAWALKRPRVGGVPALVRLWLADLAAREHELPEPNDALENPPGLCGIAHDLSVPTLLAAYRRGLFPGGHVGPTKWFSWPERCVLFFDEFHMPKRLRRQMRQGRHTVTFDRDFEAVIKACAEPREGQWHVSWITPKIMHAYAALFDAGHAHSFEVWNSDGALAGGGYGLAIGRVFFSESFFAREDNASKIGLSVLNWHLAHWGYLLNDGKNPANMTLSMGFRMIPRADFLQLLAEDTSVPGKPGRWQVETDAKTVADWQPKGGKQGPVHAAAE